MAEDISDRNIISRNWLRLNGGHCMSANLIEAVSSDTTTEISELSAYRAAQLYRTLIFLKERSPYYSELFQGVNIDGSDPRAILRSLPPMTAGQWGDLRASIRTVPLSGSTLGYTSGTSTGMPTPFLSVPRELEAHEMVSLKTMQQGSMLMLAHPYAHGAAQITGNGDAVQVHMLCRHAHFEQVRLLLEHKAEPFVALPRLQYIAGDLSLLKSLSLHLLANRGRLNDLGISNTRATSWLARGV